MRTDENLEMFNKTAQKRLKQYPEAIRKIKRLRKQIKALNRGIDKLRPRFGTKEFLIAWELRHETKKV